jgi:hypothetical protein
MFTLLNDGGDMKRTFVIILFCLFAFAVVGFAYFGSSNLMGMYPSFNGYVSYNPSRQEVERYIRAGQEYVEKANNDIRAIQDAQEDAIRKVNNVVDRYNRS